MITLHKKNTLYQVEENGQLLGWIEFFRNPYHAANCYLKIELNRLKPALGRQLWPQLRELAGRPLQVMVDASDIAMTHFLSASGFVCKRTCYEVDASVDDYAGGTADVKLFHCEAGQADYEACCQMLYRWYLDTHQAVNPWTASYEDFCAKLPSTAVYAKDGDALESAAFVEGNEIAYVCSRALPHFDRFAQSLLPAMFQQHTRIAFECDDCDPVAMLLKNLFTNQSDTGFCTYIYE